MFSSYQLTFGKRFITKCVKSLLKNVAAFLLQNVNKMCYKTRRCYYKTRAVLQNASILLQNTAGIAKRVDYYKTRHNKCELL